LIIIERAMTDAPLRDVEALPVLLFEGEVNAHQFRIVPPDPVSFADMAVTARVIRADQQEVAITGWLDERGRANIVLTAGCYVIPGNYKLFMYAVQSAEGNEKTVCIYACTGTVIDTVGANGAAPEPPEIIETYGDGEIEALEARIAAVETGDAFMPALVSYREAEMKATRDYAAGDIIAVGMNLFRTNNAIATGDTLSRGTIIDGVLIRVGNVTQITLREYLSGAGLASKDQSHAEGTGTASAVKAHAEGDGTTASGQFAHAEGKESTASGNGSHAEGYGTAASSHYSHAEGNNTTAAAISTHAEGYRTQASFMYAHAEGYYTTASNRAAHAEGEHTTASGFNCHAEGSRAVASDESAHAEGYDTTASGKYSHAEGNKSKATGESAHAEGYSTEAGGANSHTEGWGNIASGRNSHAEGSANTASGQDAHAENYSNTASGNFSHADGYSNIAKHRSQHVFGEYCSPDPSEEAATKRGTFIEIVGNGASNDAKSNARTLDWAGNESLAGGLTLGRGSVAETFITPLQLRSLLARLNCGRCHVVRGTGYGGVLLPAPILTPDGVIFGNAEDASQPGNPNGYFFVDDYGVAIGGLPYNTGLIRFDKDLTNPPVIFGRSGFTPYDFMMFWDAENGQVVYKYQVDEPTENMYLFGSWTWNAGTGRLFDADYTIQEE